MRRSQTSSAPQIYRAYPLALPTLLPLSLGESRRHVVAFRSVWRCIKGKDSASRQTMRLPSPQAKSPSPHADVQTRAVTAGQALSMKTASAHRCPGEVFCLYLLFYPFLSSSHFLNVHLIFFFLFFFYCTWPTLMFCCCSVFHSWTVCLFYLSETRSICFPTLTS